MSARQLSITAKSFLDPRKALRVVRQTARRAVRSSPIYLPVISRLILGEGEMSAIEIRKLLELVRSSDQTRPIIEIGTLFGSTALAMSYIKAESQKIICVDNFSWNPYGLSPTQHEKLTRQRLNQVIERLDVTLLSIDRKQFFASYTGPPPALVLLDADHSYEATLEDIRWAQSVNADIICGDDYGPQFPGVIQAVHDAGGAVEVADELFVMHNRRQYA